LGKETGGLISRTESSGAHQTDFSEKMAAMVSGRMSGVATRDINSANALGAVHQKSNGEGGSRNVLLDKLILHELRGNTTGADDHSDGCGGGRLSP